jgi:predicted DNA-binding protein
MIRIIQQVRLPVDVKGDIELLASYKGKSVSKTIVTAIEYYIAHEYDLIRMIKLKQIDEGDE